MAVGRRLVLSDLLQSQSTADEPRPNQQSISHRFCPVQRQWGNCCTGGCHPSFDGSKTGVNLGYSHHRPLSGFESSFLGGRDLCGHPRLYTMAI